jgi:transposase InsO family protein
MVGIASSSWHRPPRATERKRPGPPRKVIADEVIEAVVTMATVNPWYGYKRIAVMCRRAGQAVKNRESYVVMKNHGLLQKKKTRRAEVYQAAKLFELLPQGPNDLWQMDVTYIHIPGYGWWYAVTVIDYYSRYLLACHLTSSYSAAESAYALKRAREEAERIHGPLTKRPFLVTDNGSSFIARRFAAFVKDQFSHVRIQYRTPQQLGLLERFHATLKTEEVYWRMYDHPQHARECLAEFRARYNERRPHWALLPAEGGDVLAPIEVYRARAKDSDSALAGVGPGGAGQVREDAGGRRVRRTSCRDSAGIVPATRALIAAPGPRLATSRVRRTETKIVNEASHKISPADST